MTDDLRTRIIAALEALERNLAEQLFSDLPDRYYKWIGYDELADAVIAELADMGIIHLSKVRHDAFKYGEHYGI